MEMQDTFKQGLWYTVPASLAFAAVQRTWGEWDLSTVGALATLSGQLAWENWGPEVAPHLPTWERTIDTATNLTYLVSLAGGVGMFTLGITGEIDLAVLAANFTGAGLLTYWSLFPTTSHPESRRPEIPLNPPPPQDEETKDYQELGDSLKAHEVAIEDIRNEQDLKRRGELIATTRKEVSNLATVIGAARNETPKDRKEYERNALAITARDLLKDIRKLHLTWKKETVAAHLAASGYATFPVGGDGSCFAYSLVVQEDEKLGDLLFRAYNATADEQDAIAKELEGHVDSKTKLNGDFAHFRTEVRNEILSVANHGLRKRLHEWAEQNRPQIKEEVGNTIICWWERDHKMRQAIEVAVNDDQLCQKALRGEEDWPETAINTMIDRVKWGDSGHASWFDPTTIRWYCASKTVQVAVFNEPTFDEDGKLIPSYYFTPKGLQDNASKEDIPMRYVWYTEDMGGHFEPVFKLPEGQEIDLASRRSDE